MSLIGDDDEVTSLELLADYECPECGGLDEAYLPVTEDEALMVLGGDENGIMRCWNYGCDEELELTHAAYLDLLKLVAERLPEQAEAIAQRIEEVL